MSAPKLTAKMEREIVAQRVSCDIHEHGSWFVALLAEIVFLRNRVEMLERRDVRHQQEIHQYRVEIDAARPEIARLRAANSMLLDVFRDHIDALPEDIRVKLRA